MLENQDMSAPIQLAEGYNPFSDEKYVPKVEEVPTQNVENTEVQQPQVQEK